MPAALEDLIDVGRDVLGTEISDGGTITCQSGDVVSQSVTSANDEWWQHVGLASRPAKAQPGVGACQSVTINRGDHDVHIASKDIRGQAIYGNLKDGEACFYAPGAQGKLSMKLDGSVTMFTTDDNTPNGNGVYFKVAPTKLQFVAPWGTLTFDATGLHITTTSGFEFDAGSCSLPGPLADLIPNYCRIGTAKFMVDSGLIELGEAEGVFASVVNTIAPVPMTPVLCGAPGSPTVPPLTGSKGVFVTIG